MMLSLSFPNQTTIYQHGERERDIHYTKESKDNKNLKPKKPYPPIFQNYIGSTLDQSIRVKKQENKTEKKN